MTNQFAKLIKTLQREVIEEKTVRRRSSLTLDTITKNITVTVTLYRESGQLFYPTKVGLVKIDFPDGEPQLVTPTIVNANSRGVRFSMYNIDNGAGIMVIPTTGTRWDDDMTIGSSKDITITVGVVMTGDCDLTADQITWRRP